MQQDTIDLGPERSIHYRMAGEGLDVVLIHGALATSHDWLVRSFGALARNHRVIALDRPGHGASARRRFEGTPRGQAAQIREALQRIGVERPVLVGHSFGGMVSLAYAEQFGREVAGLVLVGPLVFPELRPIEHGLLAPRALPGSGPIFSQFARATIDRPTLEAVQQLMFWPEAVDPEWKAGFPYEDVLRPGNMVREGEDAASALPFAPSALIDFGRIDVPVQVVTGDGDLVVRDELHGKPLGALLPQAEVRSLPGVGHMLHVTRPELVVEAVEAVLAGLKTGQA